MHQRMLNLILLAILCLGSLVKADTETKNDTKSGLEYATSIASMVKLLDMDKALTQNLKEYAELLKEKIAKIQLLRSHLNKVHEKSKNDPEAYLSNPLNSFALIRRMHSDWPKWHNYTKRLVGHDKIDFVEKLKSKMPTDNDFREAQVGLHRLQMTYLLKTKDLAAGRIAGRQFDIKVSPLDCFVMGNYLSELKLHSEALEWFEQAREQFTPKYEKMFEVLGVGLADIWYMIADQLNDLKRNAEATEAINKALSYRPNDSNFILFERDLRELLIHERLCQVNRHPTSKFLHCRYNFSTSPFLKLAPLKMEELSLDPSVTLYHDVLYEREVKTLQESSIPFLSRAQVGEGDISPERSARSFNIDENENDLFKIINLRFADMTGLSLGQVNRLQVINYGLGGHHFSHTDYYDEESRFTSPQGNRMAIVVGFLQGVEMGGALAFPILNFSVPSRKGSAVAFYMLDNAGDNDERTLHASCPVAYGSKWSILKVFKEGDQLFTKPCYK